MSVLLVYYAVQCTAILMLRLVLVAARAAPARNVRLLQPLFDMRHIIHNFQSVFWESLDGRLTSVRAFCMHATC